MKRLVDVVGSALRLLVLSPLFGVVSAWIAVDSPGPLLFRQQPIGRHGRAFGILNFRTRRVGADGGSKITVGQDPRTTSGGLFLRRFKIDDRPQLLNVLRGDMSLVGPRPELEHYVELYPLDARRRI